MYTVIMKNGGVTAVNMYRDIVYPILTLEC